MEVKKLACPSCGASIEIDENKKSGKCKYCNSTYALDDGVIRIEYSFADEGLKREITNANVALYKFNDYDKSFFLFSSLFRRYQDNQDFLLGILLSLTHEFKKEDYSIKEGKRVLYYWDLFKKIGREENIKKHQKEIDKIEKIITEKENQIKTKNRKIKTVVVIILVLLVLFIIISLLVKPIKKNKTIKMSKFKESPNELIHHAFLKCDYVEKTINNDKLEVSFECHNFVQKRKKYVFSYKYVDDMSPYIENNDCVIEEGDKPNFECITVMDSIDGRITDFDVDESEADYNTIGETSVTIKAKDKAGNQLTEKVTINVQKIKITNMNFKIETKSYRVGSTGKASVNIEPTRLKDKTVKYSSSNPKVATIDNKGNIKMNRVGETEICVESNYDSSTKVCKNISVLVQCKNTYVFNVNASEGTKLYANEDYCPGTYRIYAPSVLNSSDFYYIYIHKDSDGYSASSQSICIYKQSSFLSDEGNKVALGKNGDIEVPAGIKKIKLVKVK